MIHQPGDTIISPSNGEPRTIIDVADYTHEEGDIIYILRYPDGDPRRELDEEGGDIHIFSEKAQDIE